MSMRTAKGGAHECLGFWGADAKLLTEVLQKTTIQERKGAAARRAGRELRSYDGWVQRVAAKEDYDRLLKLYFELCLALRQPTDVPNHHKRSVLPNPGAPVEASEAGRLAGLILDGLHRDGTDDPGGAPAHVDPDTGASRYGTPNWLEKRRDPQDTRHDPKRRETYVVARNLLQALRASMDR